MSNLNPFKALKEQSVWEKSTAPIWIASSFILQRNLSSLPFPQKMKHADSLQSLTQLKQSLMDALQEKKPTYLDFEDLSNSEKEFLLEHYLATMASKNDACKTGVMVDGSGNFLAMINGEDHLVLHLIETQSSWKEGWNTLSKLEKTLEGRHSFAYSKKFGYLTSELSNSGTALNVQAFLHLPCLIELDQIEEVLLRDLDEDVQACGLSGTEEFIGGIVVIQNKYTLGLTEDHILESVHKSATKLASTEKILRDEMKNSPDALIVDKISRAIGLLKHSYQIETKEALNALSFIKLGIQLEWISGLTDQDINRIFFDVRRGHLALASGEELSKEKLAQKRAELLQSSLKTTELTR